MSQCVEYLRLNARIRRHPDTQLVREQPGRQVGDKNFDQIALVLVKEGEVRAPGDLADRVNASLAERGGHILRHRCTIYPSRGSQRVRARGTA